MLPGEEKSFRVKNGGCSRPGLASPPPSEGRLNKPRGVPRSKRRGRRHAADASYQNSPLTINKSVCRRQENTSKGRET